MRLGYLDKIGIALAFDDMEELVLTCKELGIACSDEEINGKIEKKRIIKKIALYIESNPIVLECAIEKFNEYILTDLSEFFSEKVIMAVIKRKKELIFEDINLAKLVLRMGNKKIINKYFEENIAWCTWEFILRLEEETGKKVLKLLDKKVQSKIMHADEMLLKRRKYGITRSAVIIRLAKEKGESARTILDKRIEYELGSSSIIKLATEIGESAKTILDKRDEYKLDTNDIISLARKVGESAEVILSKWIEYKLSFNQMKNLAQESGKLRMLIDNRKEYGLESFQVIEIAKALGEDKATILLKRRQYGIDIEEILRLFSCESIEEIAKVLLKYKYYKLNASLFMELSRKVSRNMDIFIDVICRSGFVDTVLKRPNIKLLEEKQRRIEIAKLLISKRERFKIQEDLFTRLAEVVTSDFNSYMQILLDCGIVNGKISFNSENTKISLPQNLTFGIEIETEGEKSLEVIETIVKVLNCKWCVEEDGSLGADGKEIKSPVLMANSSLESAEQDINNICTMLKFLKQFISDKCGGHIHIGADHLKDAQAYVNLLELWGNTESLLYTISNEEGSTPRVGVWSFAIPISKRIEESLRNGRLWLPENASKKLAIGQINRVQNDRFSGINFRNLIDDTINTIEFRIPNGTLDPKVWIQNINLFGGMVAVSQELSDIQVKIESGVLISHDEMKKLELFEKIKTEGISNREKLEILLQLVIDEPQRQIYRDRYEVNNELIQKDLLFTQNMEEYTSKNAININKKEFSRKAFLERYIFDVKTCEESFIPATPKKCRQQDSELEETR